MVRLLRRPNKHVKKTRRLLGRTVYVREYPRVDFFECMWGRLLIGGLDLWTTYYTNAESVRTNL